MVLVILAICITGIAGHVACVFVVASLSSHDQFARSVALRIAVPAVS